jgi:nucleoid-associated protein Lsr2
VAQKIQTLLIDDLDGSAGEETVRFGLDGADYEIDLNAGHAQELRDAWPATWALPGGPAARPGGPRVARAGDRRAG